MFALSRGDRNLRHGKIYRYGHLVRFRSVEVMPVSMEPWRVGLLFSQTGVTASVEQTGLHASLLAIEEINAAGGVLDRPIEPIITDLRSIPANYRATAERLMGAERVRLLFGCYMSSCRKVTVPAVEALRGILFYPTLYEGFEYSPHCVYTGACPNQNALQLARYLLQVHGARFLMVGSNYVFPYESNRIMSDLVIQAGGKVLDEIYTPLDAGRRDFGKAIKQIEKMKPDVVFSTVVGQATAVFYHAYHEAFGSARAPIASLSTSEAEVAEMSPEAAEGHITGAPFFETLATPAARRFVRSYKHRFGEDAPVSACAEAAYFQMHLAARALRRTGTDDPDLLLRELREAEFDAPQGRVRIDSENNHTFLWPRVARIDAMKKFQIVWNPGVRVKPDPYCVVQTLDDWSADPLTTDVT
jgi:branched-chain amino acid transport system substrate-binding protein